MSDKRVCGNIKTKREKMIELLQVEGNVKRILGAPTLEEFARRERQKSHTQGHSR
ncbi:MAG: hypothetical protein LBT08_09545 [Synergistaceae bacterium]|nr:hypothetical protein [Synergistaceae bacterium]